MKKIYLLILLSILCGCVEVGNFPAKRQKLHNMNAGQEADFCEKNPDRCIEGVAW